MDADIALLVLKEIEAMLESVLANEKNSDNPRPPPSALSECLSIQEPRNRGLCLANPRGAGYYLYMKHLLEFAKAIAEEGHPFLGEERGLHNAYTSFIDTIQQLELEISQEFRLDEPLCLALETPIKTTTKNMGIIVVDRVIACIPPLNKLREHRIDILKANNIDEVVESMREIGFHMSQAALYIETHFQSTTEAEARGSSVYTRRYISYTAYETMKEMGCIEAGEEALVTIELYSHGCTASLGEDTMLGDTMLVGPGLAVFTDKNGGVTCIASEAIRSLAALSPNGITVPCKALKGTGSNTLRCRLRAS